jgi:hypothetical protein
MFSTLCYVTADISHIRTPPRIAPNSAKVYYSVAYDVIFSFGLTELKAFLAWKENVSPNLIIKVACGPNSQNLFMRCRALRKGGLSRNPTT